MAKPISLVISCEHATNFVPDEYRSLFTGGPEILNSHRGYDPGTLELGKRLAEELGCQLHATTVSRLLVEGNRSLHHKRLFSEFTSCLSPQIKREIIGGFYLPFRNAVRGQLDRIVEAGGFALHFSVHSFSPVFNGSVRNADVGILYDPSRPSEKSLAARFKEQILNLRPELKVRLNYPYLGIADGHTTHLRKIFGASQYAGIELEINQKWVLNNQTDWLQLQDTLIGSIESLLVTRPNSALNLP